MDHEYIRERHRKVSAVFPDAATRLDAIELYDTSDGARLVARGGGGGLEVIDRASYEQFLGISQQGGRP